MREVGDGTWEIALYWSTAEYILNENGATFIDFTDSYYISTGIRVIAYVDFKNLSDGFYVQPETDKYNDEPAFYVKNSCVSHDSVTPETAVLKADLKTNLGESEDSPLTQKAVNDFFIIEPNKRNVFSKNLIRTEKSIYGSSPYNIIDYTSGNIILTPFYKIPENCKYIDYGGIVADGNITARFSEDATDDGTAEIVTLDDLTGNNIEITDNLKQYNYVVFSVYRDASPSTTPELDDVWIRFIEDDSEKNIFISPRKPVILFHMDALTIDPDNHMDDYVSALRGVGINKSTYNLLPSYYSDTYLQFYRKRQLEGSELSIHTDGTYDLSPSSTLTDEEFKEAVRYYKDAAKNAGLDSVGWVSHYGTLKTTFIPILKNYVNWGQV